MRTSRLRTKTWGIYSEMSRINRMQSNKLSRICKMKHLICASKMKFWERIYLLSRSPQTSNHRQRRNAHKEIYRLWRNPWVRNSSQTQSQPAAVPRKLIMIVATKSWSANLAGEAVCWIKISIKTSNLWAMQAVMPTPKALTWTCQWPILRLSLMSPTTITLHRSHLRLVSKKTNKTKTKNYLHSRKALHRSKIKSRKMTNWKSLRRCKPRTTLSAVQKSSD